MGGVGVKEETASDVSQEAILTWILYSQCFLHSCAVCRSTVALWILQETVTSVFSAHIMLEQFILLKKDDAMAN